MVLNRHEALALLLGDLIVLYLSLWLTLLARYLAVPSEALWLLHALPFTPLFAGTVLVYFIAGLYDQHTTLLLRRLPTLVYVSQSIAVALAALVFFSVPAFGITPKTILLIFLVCSSGLMVLWRLHGTRLMGVRHQAKALVLGAGDEVEQLVRELNENPRHGIAVAHRFDPADVKVSERLESHVAAFIASEHLDMIIADIRNPHMERITPVFYNLLFLHPSLVVVDAMRLYEGLFRRIPISMLEHTWFIEHITRQPRRFYNAYHRAFDVCISLALGIVTLLITPLVALAIKLDGPGPVFSFQRRVGKDGRPLDLVKFRTMTVANDAGEWEGAEQRNTVTRVGKILRTTRIDELPQLWNVLLGGYSLIGPRPEFPAAVTAYAREIPYYNARHLITPGLSGWAQLNHDAHPHHGVDVVETRNKLSYDLYYLKHRSVWLDLEIGLKTVKALLSAMGK